MKDHAREDGQPDDLQPIDWLLGEGEAAERVAFERRTEQDPLLALEVLETVLFVDRRRGRRLDLGAGRARPGLRLEQAARPARRRAGRQRPALRWCDYAVAAAAAALVLGLLWWLGPTGERQRAGAEPAITARVGYPDVYRPAPRDYGPLPDEVQAEAATQPAGDGFAPPFSPNNEPRLYAALERFADRQPPDPLRGWLQPSNALALLRVEAELRGSAEIRRAALLRNGGNPDVDDRVQQLAAEVAEPLRAALRRAQDEPATADVRALALGLRALLAAGCTSANGEHAGLVVETRDALVTAVTRSRTADGITTFVLRDGELASALAALAEPGLFGGSALVAIVQAHGERLVQETLTARGRPGLLAWSTPLGSLADAGRVLAMLPAFGVDAEGAFRVRRLVAAHLQERRQVSDHPEVLAATLYGVVDLIDRDEWEGELRRWRPTALLPDFEALHHLAWSREPGSAGWTRFQRELRRVAATPTPAGLTDRAALLMSLATDFAAPGVANLAVLAD